jgi:hypothetical protein
MPLLPVWPTPVWQSAIMTGRTGPSGQHPTGEAEILVVFRFPKSYPFRDIKWGMTPVKCNLF